ncbi:MAG: class I SAM-dependent methyltransferase [Cyanobacteria bacterium P01_H01_bin.21]
MNSCQATYHTTSVQNMDWIEIEKCPLCLSASSKHLIDINKKGYIFGKECILIPSSRISIQECCRCGLAYKTTIPSKPFLSEVYERQVENIWTSPYTFEAEIELVKQLFPSASFDLLDVGASTGELLRQCSQFSGRRSALDIVRYPGTAKYINGEIILSLLDQEHIKWSEESYDLVTVFDVLEHLYDPQIAFENLLDFTNPEGLIVIETGNIKSYKTNSGNMMFWPYVSLFEHHIFWQKKSIEYAAELYKLEIVEWRLKKHKKNYYHSNLTRLKSFLKFVSYKTSPSLYFRLMNMLISGTHEPPGNPLSKDHLRVVFKKKK